MRCAPPPVTAVAAVALLLFAAAAPVCDAVIGDPVTCGEEVRESLTRGEEFREPVPSGDGIRELVWNGKVIGELVMNGKAVRGPVTRSEVVPKQLERGELVPGSSSRGVVIGESVSRDAAIRERVTYDLGIGDPLTSDVAIVDPEVRDVAIVDRVTRDVPIGDPMVGSKVVPETVTRGVVIDEPLSPDTVIQELVTRDLGVGESVTRDEAISDTVTRGNVVRDPITRDVLIRESLSWDAVIPEPMSSPVLMIRKRENPGVVDRKPLTHGDANRVPAVTPASVIREPVQTKDNISDLKISDEYDVTSDDKPVHDQNNSDEVILNVLVSDISVPNLEFHGATKTYRVKPNQESVKGVQSYWANANTMTSATGSGGNVMRNRVVHRSAAREEIVNGAVISTTNQDATVLFLTLIGVAPTNNTLSTQEEIRNTAVNCVQCDKRNLERRENGDIDIYLESSQKSGSVPKASGSRMSVHKCISFVIALREANGSGVKNSAKGVMKVNEKNKDKVYTVIKESSIPKFEQEDKILTSKELALESHATTMRNSDKYSELIKATGDLNNATTMKVRRVRSTDTSDDIGKIGVYFSVPQTGNGETTHEPAAKEESESADPDDIGKIEVMYTDHVKVDSLRQHRVAESSTESAIEDLGKIEYLPESKKDLQDSFVSNSQRPEWSLKILDDGNSGKTSTNIDEATITYGSDMDMTESPAYNIEESGVVTWRKPGFVITNHQKKEDNASESERALDTEINDDGLRKIENSPGLKKESDRFGENSRTPEVSVEIPEEDNLGKVSPDIHDTKNTSNSNFKIHESSEDSANKTGAINWRDFGFVPTNQQRKIEEGVSTAGIDSDGATSKTWHHEDDSTEISTEHEELRDSSHVHVGLPHGITISNNQQSHRIRIEGNPNNNDTSVDKILTTRNKTIGDIIYDTVNKTGNRSTYQEKENVFGVSTTMIPSNTTVMTFEGTEKSVALGTASGQTKVTASPNEEKQMEPVEAIGSGKPETGSQKTKTKHPESELDFGTETAISEHAWHIESQQGRNISTQNQHKIEPEIGKIELTQNGQNLELETSTREEEHQPDSENGKTESIPNEYSIHLKNGTSGHPLDSGSVKSESTRSERPLESDTGAKESTKIEPEAPTHSPSTNSTSPGASERRSPNAYASAAAAPPRFNLYDRHLPCARADELSGPADTSRCVYVWEEGRELPLVRCDLIAAVDGDSEHYSALIYNRGLFEPLPAERTPSGRLCLYPVGYSVERRERLGELGGAVLADDPLLQVLRSEPGAKTLAVVLSHGFRQVALRLRPDALGPRGLLNSDPCRNCTPDVWIFQYKKDFRVQRLYMNRAYSIKLLFQPAYIEFAKKLWLSKLDPESFMEEIEVHGGSNWGDPGADLLPVLKRLRRIDFSGNGLSHIPADNFERNPWIQELILADNSFSTFPSGISLLRNLRTLDLSGNRIRGPGLVAALLPLGQLRTLNLSHAHLRRFEALSPEASAYESDEVDSLENIAHNTSMLPLLETLDVSWNGIQNLSSPAARGLLRQWPRLRVLRLAGNPLRALPPDLPAQLPSLQALDLAQCGLHVAPAFRLLPAQRLRRLDLSLNALESPGDALSPESAGAGVEHLDLSGNPLANRWASDAFSALGSNASVNLSSTQLAFLGQEMLAALRGLRAVDLGANPLDCRHCAVLALREWLRASGRPTVLVLGKETPLACAYPVAEKGRWVADAQGAALDACRRVSESRTGVMAAVCLAVAIAACASITLLALRFRTDLVRLIHLLGVNRQMRRGGRRGGERHPDADFEFDAFVCYSKHDRAWVVGELLARLESEPPRYRLCLHDRDFPLGSLILQNIAECMARSRRTLMVLTPSFVASQWCQWELEMATHHLLQGCSDFLVLVELERLETRSLPQLLRMLLETRTFLEWPTASQGRVGDAALDTAWQRLRAALGPPLSTQQHAARSNNVNAHAGAPTAPPQQTPPAVTGQEVVEMVPLGEIVVAEK